MMGYGGMDVVGKRSQFHSTSEAGNVSTRAFVPPAMSRRETVLTAQLLGAYPCREGRTWQP